jgi:hypothetical protein
MRIFSMCVDGATYERINVGAEMEDFAHRNGRLERAECAGD